MSLDRLGFLVGTWRGAGTGVYPTIPGFAYTEEVTFDTIPGKPFVTYSQRTRAADGGPLHAEAGYLRSPGPGTAELVVAQPTGIVEVSVGRVDGGVVDVASATVARTPTALEVTAIRRRIEVVGDVLRYQLDMAAMGQPLQRHLEAELHRA